MVFSIQCAKIHVFQILSQLFVTIFDFISHIENMVNTENPNSILSSRSFASCLIKSKRSQIFDSSCFVIPLGFEPKTYCLEGSCSNPTELRNQPTLIINPKKLGAKVVFFVIICKLFKFFSGIFFLIRRFFVDLNGISYLCILYII